jgi:hypothetical protein
MSFALIFEEGFEKTFSKILDKEGEKTSLEQRFSSSRNARRLGKSWLDVLTGRFT